MRTGEEGQNALWLSQNTKRCPNCKGRCGEGGQEGEKKRRGIIERGEREEREEERERRSFDSYICIVHIEKNDGCMHMVCQLSAF